MKKIYSFVLMAAMLLVGTNAWAAGTSCDEVQAAFNNASTGIVLQQNGEWEYLSFDEGLVFNADKHFVLDLNGLELRMSNSGKVGIQVERGTLEIKNGTITNYSNTIIDLIRVIGTTETGWDATINPYSQVIVDADAHIVNNELKVSGTKYNAMTITENPTKVGDKSYANGARIDVYGPDTHHPDDANVDGYTYGIKVNGLIQRPANDSDAPYVYIHAGAKVTANQTGTGSVAAYSSGYGRWRIEGNCEGSTGLYAKGGDVDIVGNASISSNNTSAATPETGKGSGVNAGGSAIVIESNAKYPGQISVTIADNASVTATSGYAIEETVDQAVSGTMVSSISIQGGTIDGGSKGAIIIDEKTENSTTHVVSVVGGTVDGTVAVETTAIAIDQLVPGSTNNNVEEGKEPDYQVTPVTGGIKVEPNTAKNVTLNDKGWASYSFESASVAYRAVPSGVTAYIGTVVKNDQLTLSPVSGTIPSGVGVILHGDLNATFTMPLTNTAATADFSANKLQPSTEFDTDKAANKNIYILHGEEIWLYTGDVFKANKAYLPYAGAASSFGAPARIQMVIAETQDIENVEFEAVKAVKFIENGQVLIKRGENIYNVQGQIVK